MKAIILSAGEGSRMRPLTLTKPKTMLPVAGKPIIQYNIESLRDNGIKDILLIVRYKEEMVRDYFGDGHDFGVNISYKTQKDFLGTANAISYGEDFIKDSLIVLNGDIILDNEIINEIIKKYNYMKPDTLMLLTEVEDPSAFGVVEIENGNIKSIVEKPKKEEAPSNLVNAGIYVFNKDIFEKIKKTELSERGEYEITDSVSLQIADGKTVIGHKTSKDWIDVGRPWELIEVNEELISQLKTDIKGHVEDGAHIHGEIFLDEGSIIRAGVYIEGNVYIGKNCDIGPNSYIRGNSYFGDNVHVGNAVEIKNSIIMENTNVSHLSYVGDSVIGSNCNIAAGTNIANLRFDNRSVKTKIKNQMIDSGRRKFGSIIGDSVKTGINSSFSPGVKVGHNSTIGSGVLLYDDVPSNTRVLVKQNHIIQDKKNNIMENKKDSIVICPGAQVIGKVELGEDVSIWHGAVLRGDTDSITIGNNSNVQDNCVVHCTKGFPVKIGDNVSVGHGAVVHGCTLEDNVLIGMNATVLNGAHIGKNSIVGAGAVVSEGKEFPENSLILGVPAKLIKELSPEQVQMIQNNADNYVRLSKQYKDD